MMKKIAFVFFFSGSFLMAVAQDNNPDKLHESAKAYMQKGDFDNALQALNQAKELKPNDVEITKDLAYVSYLRRDYAKAIEVSKTLTDKNEADEQSFQIFGLAYKAIAEYDAADKMYKAALKQFPKSGVLYSEHGDLLQSQKDGSAAIKQWEKGIEVAPSYSGNYFFASKYYHDNNEPLWSLLYGETFINLESLSGRTIEIKNVLLEDYKKIFLTPGLLATVAKKDHPFTKAVAETYIKYTSLVDAGITPETLTALRSKFIADWFANSAAKFPYRLFEHQQQLIKEGLFDSYNQWIFGAATDSNAFREWLTGHETEIKAFQTYQRNALFKVPAGQYYAH